MSIPSAADSWRQRRLPKRLAGSERAMLALLARLHRSNLSKSPPLDLCWATLRFLGDELGLSSRNRNFVSELTWRLQARGLISRVSPYDDPQLEAELEQYVAEGRMPRMFGPLPDIYRVLDDRVRRDPAKYLDEVLGTPQDVASRQRARRPRRRKAVARPRADQPTLPFEHSSPPEQARPSRDCVGDAPRDCVGDAPRDCVGDAPRDCVGDAPRDCVGDAPRDCVGDAPRDCVGDAPRDCVGDAPRDCVGDAPRDCVGDAPVPSLEGLPSKEPTKNQYPQPPRGERGGQDTDDSATPTKPERLPPAIDIARRFSAASSKQRGSSGQPYYPPDGRACCAEAEELLRHARYELIVAEIERDGRDKSEWFRDLAQRLTRPHSGGSTYGPRNGRQPGEGSRYRYREPRAPDPQHIGASIDPLKARLLRDAHQRHRSDGDARADEARDRSRRIDANLRTHRPARPPIQSRACQPRQVPALPRQPAFCA